MFQPCFRAALVLPMSWRGTLGAFLGSSLGTAREVFFFAVPLVLVLIPLCLIGFAAGAYGLFIPIMLCVFWSPQLALICFFAWCEREGKG